MSRSMSSKVREPGDATLAIDCNASRCRSILEFKSSMYSRCCLTCSGSNSARGVADRARRRRCCTTCKFPSNVSTLVALSLSRRAAGDQPGRCGFVQGLNDTLIWRHVRQHAAGNCSFTFEARMPDCVRRTHRTGTDFLASHFQPGSGIRAPALIANSHWLTDQSRNVFD